ncbi:hypothetical protein Aduo_007886 [Ancylostoma duodenale]
MTSEQVSPKTFDLQLIVSAVSVLYYAYILIVTLRSNSEVFRSAFFVICRVTGFFDTVGIFVVEWIRNGRKVGFGPSVKQFTRLVYAMSGVTLFTHLIGCFLMTLNRFTAVCFPWAYEKIWSRKIVYIMLLTDFMVAVGVHVRLLFIPLIYEKENNTWKLLGRESHAPVIRIVSCSTVVFYACTSVLLISKTIYISLKMNKKSGYHHKMVTLLVFIIMSMNSYSIMFLSKDLRVEAIGPFRRKLKYWCPSTVISAVIVSKH